MLRRLIEFWILDSLVIEPMKFVWGKGAFSSPSQKIEPRFDPSLVSSELCRLHSEKHIVGKVEVPLNLDQLCEGKIIGDVRLSSSGGRRWEMFAQPNWDLYASTSYNQRQRVCIRSTSKERIALEAYRFYRFNSMSEMEALRFQVDCEIQIQNVRCKIVYWKDRVNAYKLYVPTSSSFSSSSTDSATAHLAWVQSDSLSEKWCLFGFGNRFARNVLLSSEGLPDMTVICEWERNTMA